MSDSIVDKLARVALKEGTKPQLWTSDITEEKMREYLPQLLESLSKKNPKEEDRKTDREGKDFSCPISYAVLEGNQILFNKKRTKGGTQGADVAELIFFEILNHGRQTLEELCSHIGAVDRILLQMIINAMHQDEFLDQYTEKDGTQTLELVDVKDRNKRLGLTTPSLTSNDPNDKKVPSPPPLKKETPPNIEQDVEKFIEDIDSKEED